MNDIEKEFENFKEFKMSSFDIDQFKIPKEKINPNNEHPVVDPIDHWVPKLNSQLDWENRLGFNGGPVHKRKSYQVVLLSYSACVIDALVLFSMSTAFLYVFSLIMKTSFSFLVSSFLGQTTLITLAQVYIMVAFFYLIILRHQFGSTIGEWVFDLRLGRPTERLLKGYLFRVTERTVLVFLTGIIPLSLVSIIIKRDLAGDITGLRLYSLK